MLNSSKNNNGLKGKFWFFVLALIGIDLCLAITYGLNHSLDIPTFHLDGAYQTASGLHRLADGQWPGKDFYPYLGVGLTFFLYPVFLIAGNDMAASVFASHFLVACGFATVIGTIAGLQANSNRLLISLVFSTLGLAAVLGFDPNLPYYLSERIDPGASLRPLRSLIPYIVAVLAYLIFKSKAKPFVAFGMTGLLAGLAFLWSNDFGLPTFGMLVAFAFYWALQQRTLTIPVAMLILTAALLSAAIGLSLTTSGHALDLLRYNFEDVRFDQYWYFGPWSETSRIFSVSDIWEKLIPDFGWWSLVLVALGIKTIFRPSLNNSLLLMIGLILVGGGTVAILGGHRDPGYVAAFLFWCKVSLVLQVIFYIPKLLFTNKAGGWVFSQFTGLLVALVIGSGGLVASVNLNQYLDEKQLASSDSDRFYVDELGGYLPRSYETLMSMARGASDEKVVEEYWGLWSAVTRTYNQLPVDSLIHALGKTRELFAANVKDNPPDIVITTTRSMSVDWQPWNLSANYWFYKQLLKQYEPEKASPTTVIWRKGPLKVWPTEKCEIHNGEKPYFSLPESLSGFYEIDLKLSDHLKGTRELLLVKNNISPVTKIGGYISLNPNELDHQFPVAVLDTRPKAFDLFLVSAKPDLEHPIRLKSCQARRIDFDYLDIASIKNYGPEESSYNYSDVAFLNGFGRALSLFFVSNSVENEERYEIGRTLKFSNGETRTIMKRSLEHRMFIAFDGLPLDGNEVGYPHTIEVIQ